MENINKIKTKKYKIKIFKKINLNKYNMIFLPYEIQNLIREHLNAIILQTVFKLNRPLTTLNYGDRVMFKKSNDKFIYGTISQLYSNHCKIKLLPRLIPNWKKCNINFWINYGSILNDYYFPYFTPKALIVSKKKIIKLNDWNVSLDAINYIDGTKRVNNNNNNNDNNKFRLVSNMFNYYF